MENYTDPNGENYYYKQTPSQKHAQEMKKAMSEYMIDRPEIFTRNPNVSEIYNEIDRYLAENYKEKKGFTDVSNHIEEFLGRPLSVPKAQLMLPSERSEEAMRRAREGTLFNRQPMPTQFPLVDDRDETPERMVEEPSMLSRVTRRLPCVGSLCPKSKTDGGRRRSRRARRKSRRRSRK